MNFFSNNLLLYAFAIGFYAVATVLSLQVLRQPSGHVLGKGFVRLRSVLPVLALVAHAALWHEQVFGGDGMRFGFAHALSITFWLVALLTWVEAMQNNTAVLEAIAYPLAAAVSVLPALFGGASAGAYLNSVLFKLHIAIAIGSYSLLTIAAAHAALMSVQEKRLHSLSRLNRLAPEQVSRVLAYLDHLPPLLVMERLLFRIITLGFILLTLTLVSGVVFSEQWFHRAMRFDHKTIFAFISWVLFAALLVGRHVYGWRGKVALRWTMSGFVTLMLAYIGSRFVMEVILHKVG
jgi:ABC-type uncharacterized transport system permease subunit